MTAYSRPLTPLEINMAHRVFSDGINYTNVKIYRGIPFIPNHKVAISPNGNIYFPKNYCPDDFTLAGSSYQLWLIHELTHVWQHQQGFKTWFGGILLAISGGYLHRKAYIYPKLEQIQHFSQLNMEQQADLVAHYYAARYLPNNIYTAQLKQFENILHDFLNHPRQPLLLPKYRTAFRDFF